MTKKFIAGHLETQRGYQPLHLREVKLDQRSNEVTIGITPR